MLDLIILQQIVEDLKGQASKDLPEVCEDNGIDYESLQLEDLYYIDSEIFNCEQCGWWCEINEIYEGEQNRQICQDCGEFD